MLSAFFQDGQDRCCDKKPFNLQTQLCCPGGKIHDMAEVRTASFLPKNGKSKSMYCSTNDANITLTRAIVFVGVALLFGSRRLYHALAEVIPRMIGDNV